LVELEKQLRAYNTPVISRIYKDRLILDIRTIMDDEFETIESALLWAFSILSQSNEREGGGRT